MRCLSRAKKDRISRLSLAQLSRLRKGCTAKCSLPDARCSAGVITRSSGVARLNLKNFRVSAYRSEVFVIFRGLRSTDWDRSIWCFGDGELENFSLRAFAGLELSRCRDQLLLRYRRYSSRAIAILAPSSLPVHLGSQPHCSSPTFHPFHPLSAPSRAASRKIVLLRFARPGGLCIIDMFYGESEGVARRESVEENIGRWVAIKCAWRPVFVFSTSMLPFPVPAKLSRAAIRADRSSLEPAILRRDHDEKI